MSEVTAIVVGPSADCMAALPAEQVAAAMPVPSLAGLLSAARAAASPLLWILDSGTVASEETLPALAAAGHTPAASLPVGGDGAVVEAALGRFTEDDVPALLDAAEDRLVPLRHTRPASLLIRRDDVLDAEAPDPERFGPQAGTEWTGRVFARRSGMLVPASTVRVARPAAGSPAEVLRAARAGHWGKGETLRELWRALGHG